MKIGDIVKSRHTGQEYRVVEMNKKHKSFQCASLFARLIIIKDSGM